MHEFVGEPWKQWEVPVLVLISLTLQVILVLWGNRRKNTNNQLLNAVLWSSYMAADPVAILALGVISSNLTEFLTFTGSDVPLSPRMELLTFWAPCLLLHLGGPDTITAFQMEDNELWRRHLLSLVVQTGLTLYILFRAWNLSTLSALSILMFTAGSIKYAERTCSLWNSSYENRRQKADQVFARGTEFVGDVSGLSLESEINLVMVATRMWRDTEGMFADAFVRRNQEFKQIVEERSSSEVMKLIEMELKMMYDKLYTKARVIFSYTGIALRFISFLLGCIALILFSSLDRRQQQYRKIPEYSLTFLVFAVSIGLELYAAFVFLTSYWTISWFRDHGMAPAARSMNNLAKLRTRNWSNLMGQFSEISYLMQCQPKKRQLMRRIFLSSRISLYVYPHIVHDELKHFIHEYLKEASTQNKYSQQLPLLQSRGRVPWDKYIHDDDDDDERRYPVHGRIDPAKALEHLALLFDSEFGEMIIFLHLVTEVCYYTDRHVFENNIPDEYRHIFRMSKVSKHLSRYLMHLFVDSSDLLPQRTPLSKSRFYEEFNPSWKPFFTSFQRYNARGGQGEGERRKANPFRDCWAQGGEAGGGRPTYENEKGRAAKARACKIFLERSGYIGSSEAIFALQFAHILLKIVRADDVSLPQLKRRWELLGAVWVELLVYAADQCKGKAHAEHLRQGGELLTHVWVLLGHFGFIDEAILPLNNFIKRERFFFSI